MLDHASPEFIKQLSATARPQDKPFPTSLVLPSPRKKLLEWSADQKTEGERPADSGWQADAATNKR
jgi:hypothetical protein